MAIPRKRTVWGRLRACFCLERPRTIDAGHYAEGQEINMGRSTAPDTVLAANTAPAVDEGCGTIVNSCRSASEEGVHDDGASYSSSLSEISDSDLLYSSSPLVALARPPPASPPPGVPPLPLREHGLVAETPRGLRMQRSKAAAAAGDARGLVAPKAQAAAPKAAAVAAASTQDRGGSGGQPTPWWIGARMAGGMQQDATPAAAQTTDPASASFPAPGSAQQGSAAEAEAAVAGLVALSEATPAAPRCCGLLAAAPAEAGPTPGAMPAPAQEAAPQRHTTARQTFGAIADAITAANAAAGNTGAAPPPRPGAAGAGKQALPTGANQQITPLPARARRPASALPKQAALAPASRLPQASGRPAALGGAAPHASLIRPGSALRAQRSWPAGAPPPRPPPATRLPGPPPPGIRPVARPPAAGRPLQSRLSTRLLTLAAASTPESRDAIAAAYMRGEEPFPRPSPFAAVVASATGMGEVGGSCAPGSRAQQAAPEAASRPATEAVGEAGGSCAPSFRAEQEAPEAAHRPAAKAEGEAASASASAAAAASQSSARSGNFYTPREAFTPRVAPGEQRACGGASPGWTPGGFRTARSDLAGSPSGQPSPPSDARLKGRAMGMTFTCATNPLFM